MKRCSKCIFLTRMASLNCHKSADTSEVDQYIGESDLAQYLPPGWPFNELKSQPCSLDYSQALQPVVNKAQEHLELLKLSLTKWLHCQSEQRKDVTPKSTAKEGIKLAAREPATTNVVLRIDGTGQQPQISASKTSVEVIYLGAEEVINEVMLLLARLQLKRQAVMEKLNVERRLVAVLSNKLDRLALARMIALPAIVQKEHEACVKDLAELKWHVTYRSRTETHLASLVNNARVLNSQLIEDVDRTKTQVPLITEKLQLELEAIVKIQNAQKETDNELMLTLGRCSEVQKRYNDAFSKATQERAAIQADLDTYRHQLQRVREQLSSAESQQQEYTATCSQHRRTIQQQDIQLPAEIARNDAASVKQTRQANRVNLLEDRLLRTEAERDGLEEELDKLKLTAIETRKEQKSVTKHWNEVIATKDGQLVVARNRNKEKTMDNENLDWKSRDLDRQHETAMKSVDRLNKDLDRTNIQLAKLLEDVTNVEIICNSKQREFGRQQETCFTDENSIKTTTEMLRKTIKEEMQRKILLRAKIDKGLTDTEVARAKCQEQEAACVKKEIDVKKALAEIKAKVDAMQTAWNSVSQTQSKLEADVSSVQHQADIIKTMCTDKMISLSPEHAKVAAELAKVTNQLNNMNEDTEMMRKGLEDMESSTVMIDRASHTAQQDIDQLQSELDELTKHLNAVITLRDDADKALKRLQEHDDQLETQHQDVMSQRQQVLLEHSTDLSVNKSLNQSLASNYRMLQNQLIANKTVLISTFDERIRLEKDVNDARQLLAVQQRVHAALQLYYKYRGLFTSSELFRMERDSSNNAIKLSTLQHQIDSSLVNISRFVQSQIEMAKSRSNRPQQGTADAILVTVDAASIAKARDKESNPNPTYEEANVEVSDVGVIEGRIAVELHVNNSLQIAV